MYKKCFFSSRTSKKSHKSVKPHVRFATWHVYMRFRCLQISSVPRMGYFFDLFEYLLTQRQQRPAASMLQDVQAYAHNTSGRCSTVQHEWSSASFHALQLFSERWICVLSPFYSYGSSVSVFMFALILGNYFLNVFAIFFSISYHISAVFMLFLRSAPFVNPLLLDKSAFYLTVNHYHGEGRREAEGKQNGLTTYSQPSGILPFL